MNVSKKILHTVDVILIICALGAMVFAWSSVVSATYPNVSRNIGSFVSLHGRSQLSYTPIAPIPDVYNGVTAGSGGTNVSALIGNIFKVGVGLCSALAVIMIIYGGFLYISAEGFGAKSNAKDIISHALGGLLLALCIYLILFSVNQSLLNANFFTDLSSNKAGVTISQDGVAPGQPGYPAAWSSPVSNNYGSTYYGDPSVGSAQPPIYSGNNPRLDTDGKNPPPFFDPDYNPLTSLGTKYDSNTDPYIVVNDASQLGKKFIIYDADTQQSIVALGVDTGHGAGEISIAAARGLGMSATSNSLPAHNITIRPYTGG